VEAVEDHRLVEAAVEGMLKLMMMVMVTISPALEGMNGLVLHLAVVEAVEAAGAAGADLRLVLEVGEAEPVLVVVARSAVVAVEGEGRT